MCGRWERGCIGGRRRRIECLSRWKRLGVVGCWWMGIVVFVGDVEFVVWTRMCGVRRDCL